MRSVRLYCYDPVRDPTARLRLEYDSDCGNAILSDEDTLPEQVRNADAHARNVLASLQLTTACVRWLHEATGALLNEMERADTEVSK